MFACAFILACLCQCTKNYCTIPVIGGGIGIGVSQMLNILHYSFLCDGQGADRRAISYEDKSCCMSRLIHMSFYDF